MFATFLKTSRWCFGLLKNGVRIERVADTHHKSISVSLSGTDAG
jgi:hypothetical protein